MTSPLDLAREWAADGPCGNVLMSDARLVAQELIRVKSALLRSGEDSAKIIGALGDELHKCREELREAQAKISVLEGA